MAPLATIQRPSLETAVEAAPMLSRHLPQAHNTVSPGQSQLRQDHPHCLWEAATSREDAVEATVCLPLLY